MSWQVFDREAERYEAWYEAARGARAFAQESRLLAWLLDACHGARSVLDVGCGCGRFTSWLAERGFRTVRRLGRAASGAFLRNARDVAVLRATKPALEGSEPPTARPLQGARASAGSMESP